MNEILLKILHTVDLLGLVGEKLKVKEHIEAIFDVLGKDYENFMMTFNMHKCDELASVEEVEALLVAQEVRIERKTRNLDVSQGSIYANFVGTQRNDRGRGFSGNASGRGGVSLLVLLSMEVLILEVVVDLVEVVVL